ncbi:aminomethyl transferase family protein [Rhizobium sp. FKY42]|uniref:aminomethyl transferase family protein n=1 Tax=Rhizobium sp. FKY42 TaxID=2562310 RepID=UPI0014852930|nr:aminomethyl transferase family protein [Rhizobium sp. FKY42]
MRNLNDLVRAAGGAENLLRADKYDRADLPPAYDPGLIIPNIPQEFSRWERESRSWRETVALFDQSHHMAGVFVSGPDAQKLLGRLSCNSLFKSVPNRASQIICVNDDGMMIGDGIVFHLEQNLFSVYGAPMVSTWIKFHAERSDLDVEVVSDDRSPVYANGFGNTRPNCRYQLQGPLAGKLIEKLNGGPIGDVKFFGMTEITIAGHHCRALRHGMAGAMGLELWGDWEHRVAIREAIIRAGEEFGLCVVGGMAYLVPAIESGWYQAVLPAIYHDDPTLDAYRSWTPETDHNALMMLVGSKSYQRIEDYYRTPYDLDLGKFLNLENDCIGRDALSKLANAPSSKKVTLAWNRDDAKALFGEMLTPGGRNVKFLHLPANCDTIGIHYDHLTRNGRDVGTSAYTAYSANERTILSMALVEESVEIGDELTLTWGEAGGGYGNHVVPATDPFQIRAIVSPAPYSRVARETYRTAEMA